MHKPVPQYRVEQFGNANENTLDEKITQGLLYKVQMLKYGNFVLFLTVGWKYMKECLEYEPESLNVIL